MSGVSLGESHGGPNTATKTLSKCNDGDGVDVPESTPKKFRGNINVNENCITTQRERMKETSEYKKALDEELVSRQKALAIQLNNLMEIKELEPLLCIRSSNVEIDSLDFLELMDLPEDSQYFHSDNYRASMLVTVLETLQGFVNVYKELISFPEIFMPIAKLLCKLAGENLFPDALREKMKDVSQLIDMKSQEHHMLRQHLKMRKKKPVPIRMLNTKFKENYVKGRDYDPDRELAEKKKLKKRIKEEAKGAVRELRKDNEFLSKAKEREKALLAAEKAEKYGKALAFLQEQEHAFKSGKGEEEKKMKLAFGCYLKILSSKA